MIIKIPKINPETIIAVVAFILSGLVTWHVVTIGMMKALVDQNSHLNLARQMFDSITPGVSQIGFWPPLLHILMAPASYFDSLYYSGLAGYVVLAPSFVVASIFLYRICVRLTGNTLMSMAGVAIFISNPFILYYTATPMMEVLYLSFLFASAYFFLKWFEDQNLRTLIITGLCVSLTTLSRFEGIFLIPVSIILVMVHQLQKKKAYYEMEAIGIIFGIVGLIGLAFIFSYGYIYGNSIFAFANSQWSAFNQQRDYLLPTEHNVISSFMYLIHASYHVLGRPIVIFSFICLALLRQGFGGRGDLKIVGTLAILGTPFLFDIVALFRGNAIIYVPELLPYGVFFNERYGLYWIGFVIVAIVLALSTVHAEAKKIRFGYGLNLFLINTIVSFILIWSFGWFVEEVYINNYALVKDSAQGYPSHDQAEVATYLRLHYDWGKVFMTRALHDFVAVESHVALKNYVHESNYKYFDQVLERPWLFARWVVMYNPKSYINGGWAKYNERISGRYGDSEEFKKYYTLVVENERERLYVIKPEAVVEYVAKKNYSVKTIPSLNPALQYWTPDIVYTKMTESRFSMAEVSKSVLTPELLVSSQFIPFYTNRLQPFYRDGYFTDDEGGNSIYQSYALLQSYFARDQKTFDRVWNFTRNNLQHQQDNLFSSMFAVNPTTKTVTVVTSTVAITADTDIAYVLLRAGKTWNNPTYTREATLIISDLWNERVASVAGKFVISSEKDTTVHGGLDIKTSSIAPYAYHEFAQYDKAHNWEKLAADSYVLLNHLSGQDVHPNTNVFLPAQGAVLVKSTNKLQLPSEKYYSGDFVADAYQVYWRVGMDAVLNKYKTAQNYMYVTNIFDEDWKKGRVCTIIRYEEKGYSCKYDLQSLSAPLAVWTVKDSKKAEELIAQYYLKNRDLSISSDASFYEKSWYWFGLGLWSNAIAH